MDFKGFRRLPRIAAVDSNNGTQVLDFTSSILESLIPGYGVVSRIILDVFGLDIGNFVSSALLAFTVYTACRYLYKRAGSFTDDFLLSSITFDESDSLYVDVLDWISRQHVAKIARRLRAKSTQRSNSDDLEEDGDIPISNHGEIFHFAKYEAQRPPRYEPAHGSYRFWWNGYLYIFERSRRERPTMTYMRSGSTDEETINLKALWPTTEPLKALIQYIKEWSVANSAGKTKIFYPRSNWEGRGGRTGSWICRTVRHVRPIDTVVLGQQHKDAIIADMNEFLSPATPRWYATRGIPLRRGYLFHGPPGTGKSSLSFALAGVFGLDIHVVSLLEASLTESDLTLMFLTLPRRCIVLLEDIDTAGLKRDEDAAAAVSTTVNPTYDQTTMGLRGRSAASGNNPANKGLSLSGLLNAIDGVAAHEGRILVMTTNHPELLDPALTRPGRIDMTIKFGLATRQQVSEIFYRMYWHESDTRGKDTVSTKTQNLAAGEKSQHREKDGSLSEVDALTPPRTPIPSDQTTKPHNVPLTESLVRSLATEFAKQVPEDRFSPAQVQNFLIMNKKDPWKAIDGADEWVAEAIKLEDAKKEEN